MKKLLPILYIGLTIIGLCLILSGCNEAGNSAAPETGGTGGSMARFAITGNTLYIVSKQSLEVYDISQGNNPVKTVKRDMNVGIETIFPYKNNLFIGATDGMYIYDNKDPKAPVLLSTYSHIQSCDPVVVQDKYAYVTLRGGVACRPGGQISTLDVIDVSNLRYPQIVYSLPMLEPYGLGVSGNRLFVCEGTQGLKVMDITDPAKPVEKEFLRDLPSYDVIVKPNHLIVTGQNGLSQYRFDAADKFELLSNIPVL